MRLEQNSNQLIQKQIDEEYDCIKVLLTSFWKGPLLGVSKSSRIRILEYVACEMHRNFCIAIVEEN